jgi:hypothetical protein
MTELSKNTQVPQCDKTAVMHSILLKYLPYGVYFNCQYGRLKLIGYNGRFIFENGDSAKNIIDLGYVPELKNINDFLVQQQLSKFSRYILGIREDLYFHKITWKKGKNGSLTINIPNRDTGGHIQITTFLGYNKHMVAEHYNWFLENHYDIYGVL